MTYARRFNLDEDFTCLGAITKNYGRLCPSGILILNTQATKPYGHSQYFAALDGFRGVFALLVAVHHSAWFSYLNYRTFIDQAFVVIDLFFAFSGFLLYTLYHNKLGNKAECTAFMKRRFARLYPLHLFMLFVFIAYALLRVFANKTGIAGLTEGEILPFQAGAPENWATLLSNFEF